MSDALPALRQAEAMDRMYRYTRHIYDLTRKPYLLGRDLLIERLDLERGGTVLEMGCGTGRNLVALAKHYPKAELYGFDISEEMLKTARANVARAGLSARIRLAQGDATDFDPTAAFGIARFDRVYYSYALSMIPPWAAALKHGLTLTAEGGLYGVVDFGFLEGLGAPARGLLHGWLKLFHVEPRADLEAKLAALAAEHGRSLAFERPYRGYAQLGVLR